MRESGWCANSCGTKRRTERSPGWFISLSFGVHNYNLRKRRVGGDINVRGCMIKTSELCPAIPVNNPVNILEHSMTN